MGLSVRRILSLFTVTVLGTAGGLWLLRDRADDAPLQLERGVSEVAYNPAMADLRLRVTINGQRGFIDGGGRTVIEPKFELAMPFSEGLAAVANRDPVNGMPTWHFVDGSGRVVIARVFVGGQIGTFHEGMAPIMIAGKWGYIDTTGKFVVQPQFDGAADFSQGLASIRVGGKFGVIDKTGQFVLEPTYDFIGKYSDNFVLFAQNDRFGYLDRRGQVAIAPAYEAACDFSEGLAFVQTHGGKNATGTYVDTTGRPTFTPREMVGGPFQQGMASVQSHDDSYFIDPTGQTVIRGDAEERFGNFSEGLAPASIKGSVGFINLVGQMVIKPQWQDVGGFERGVCRVYARGLRGYINTSGQYIWKLQS